MYWLIIKKRVSDFRQVRYGLAHSRNLKNKASTASTLTQQDKTQQHVLITYLKSEGVKTQWRIRQFKVNLPSKNILSRICLFHQSPTDIVPCPRNSDDQEQVTQTFHTYSFTNTQRNVLTLSETVHTSSPRQTARYPGGPLTNPAPTSSQ